MQLQQGREPPLLLGLIEKKRSCSLCVLRAFSMPPGTVREVVLFLEASETRIKLQVTTTQLVEISQEEATIPLSPFKSRISVTIILSPPSASVSSHTAKKISVSIVHGALSSESVQAAARQAARHMRHILKLQQASAIAVLEASARKHSRAVSVSDSPSAGLVATSPMATNQDRTRSTSTASAASIEGTIPDLITIPEKVVSAVSEKIESMRGVSVVSALRSVRLFQVCKSILYQYLR